MKIDISLYKINHMKKYFFILLLAVGCSKDEESSISFIHKGTTLDLSKYTVVKYASARNSDIFGFEIIDKSTNNTAFGISKSHAKSPLIILTFALDPISRAYIGKTSDTLIGTISVDNNGNLNGLATSKKGSKLELKNY